MKCIFLQIFWNFCGLVAVNPNIQMEVCQVNMTNNAREPLQLRYSECFQKSPKGNMLFRPIYTKSMQYFWYQNKPIRDELTMHFSGNSTQIQARPDSKRLVLTPQGQLSLQGTFVVWMDVNALLTKADEGEAGI